MEKTLFASVNERLNNPRYVKFMQTKAAPSLKTYETFVILTVSASDIYARSGSQLTIPPVAQSEKHIIHAVDSHHIVSTPSGTELDYRTFHLSGYTIVKLEFIVVFPSTPCLRVSLSDSTARAFCRLELIGPYKTSNDRGELDKSQGFTEAGSGANGERVVCHSRRTPFIFVGSAKVAGSRQPPLRQIEIGMREVLGVAMHCIDRSPN